MASITLYDVSDELVKELAERHIQEKVDATVAKHIDAARPLPTNVDYTKPKRGIIDVAHRAGLYLTPENTQGRTKLLFWDGMLWQDAGTFSVDQLEALSILFQRAAHEIRTSVDTTTVRSFTRDDVSYTVTRTNGVPTSCTCPDFENRQRAIDGKCKHMSYVEKFSVHFRFTKGA